MMSRNSKHKLEGFTLAEHFLEFRSCLMKVVLSFIIVTIITFQFSWDIFRFLSKPLASLSGDYGNFHFIYTKLTEGFMTELKISFISSFFLCSPIFSINFINF